MKVLEIYDEYIERLYSASYNNTDLGALIEEVSRVMFEETEIRELALDYFLVEDANLREDINKIRAKLEYKKALLEDENERKRHQEEVEKEKRELEKLKLQAELQKGSFAINNYNNNEAYAYATVTVSIEQTIQNINDISSKKLSDDEKLELEEKLYSIEGMKHNKDKSRLKTVIGKTLKYIADKSIEVVIAALPYLGEISKLIQ